MCINLGPLRIIGTQKVALN